MTDSKIVILESPYAGDVEKNIAYAKRCALHSLSLNEAPMLSHLLYTQFLDDLNPVERAMGINAGLAWRKVAQASVVYIDLGISKGMQYGIDAAHESGIPIEYRFINKKIKNASN